MRDPVSSITNTFWPMVVEQTNRGERGYDLSGAPGGSPAATPRGPGRGGAPACSSAASRSWCWPPQSGIGAYDDVLFWDHMVQHLMLLMVAPPLLVVGQPITLLLHASRNPLHTWAKRVVRSRVASFLTWPPFGLAAYAATIVGTHLTGLSRLILQNQTLHNAEHVLLPGRRVPVLPAHCWARADPLAAVVPDPVVGPRAGHAGRHVHRAGARLRRPGRPSCPPGRGRPGRPAPVQDLHWAGAVMWVAGDAIMFGCNDDRALDVGRDDRASLAAAGWRRRAGPASRSWSGDRPGRRPRCRNTRAGQERRGNRGPRRRARARSTTTSISPPTTPTWPG